MSHSSTSKRKATLYGQELKCKNDCGYFGNPEWLGYCSKCHKELNQNKVDRSTKASSKKVQRSFSDVHESSLSLGFSKFEEKKKQQTEKRTKTIKSIIKRGHTTKESTSNSPSRDSFALSEIFQSNESFKIKDAVAKDVTKQINRTLDIMSKYYDKPTDEQSDVVQDFYNFMANRCETHPAYQDMSSEQVDMLMDKIEEVLMSNLHRNVSQQMSSEYEDKDLAIQKRIRSLNWIASQHLGLNISESSPEVRDLIDKAIADMIEMDSKIVPQQKIKCIVTCSKSIFDIIQLCQVVPASADEFLPAMVYIVLKANPPLLQSNIKYITSYSIPARLRSGEGAYYFTNLCCAVSFIDDLTAESLNMNEDEFQRYLSGEVPFPHGEQNASTYEGLRVMNLNLRSLNEIEEKNKQMINDLNDLKEDMQKFQETLQKSKPQTPLLINQNPYTIPGNTDMSLVPEMLRNRVLFAPSEDILVDIDNPPQPARPERSESLMGSSPVQTASRTPSVALGPAETFSSDRDASVLSSFPSSAPPLDPLQSLLQLQTAAAASDSSIPALHYSQAMADIQDLEYPTEMIAELKSEDSVEFGPFEGCDPLETNAEQVGNPLPSESEIGFEENLNLPPPLQPVVVQTPNESQNP